MHLPGRQTEVKLRKQEFQTKLTKRTLRNKTYLQDVDGSTASDVLHLVKREDAQSGHLPYLD